MMVRCRLPLLSLLKTSWGSSRLQAWGCWDLPGYRPLSFLADPLAAGHHPSQTSSLSKWGRDLVDHKGSGPCCCCSRGVKAVRQFGTSQRMSGIGSLAITKPAPEFEANAVVNGEFKTVKLSDYRGKYVILFFYPLDFTFVCPTEIIAFSDRAEEFRAIGTEVLAASTDSVFSHLAWVNTPRKQGGLGAMNIPLLADKTGEIAEKYGCLKKDEGIAFRGLYIIDDKGNLRQITINDLPVGRSVDETLRLVQAFQFTDKHGEVCPAGWKPGEKTMKPDPKGSQEYFNKAN